jgi:hypothetical protein
MIDNSQGHSAYAEDTLLISRMNVGPGGKQARMRNGWFIQDGQNVSQPMIFPSDHPGNYADQPKGIKTILAKQGIVRPGLCGKCKKCEFESESCCLKRILENQPDFLAQKSLVQEVIEAAGHMCIFLPKFHCELNFIEYYWSAVKKYLREHCDFTFNTLKANMPKHWNLYSLAPFESGNTGCTAGWMLIDPGWAQQMHRHRSRSSVQPDTSLTDVSRSL